MTTLKASLVTVVLGSVLALAVTAVSLADLVACVVPPVRRRRSWWDDGRWVN